METPKLKQHVLIVEDARMFSKILQSRHEERGFSVVVAEGLAFAREQIGRHRDLYFIANGEIVDYATACTIPCIVFTGFLMERGRNMAVIE